MADVATAILLQVKTDSAELKRLSAEFEALKIKTRDATNQAAALGKELSVASTLKFGAVFMDRRGWSTTAASR